MIFDGDQVGEVDLNADASGFDHVVIEYRDSDGQVCSPVSARDGETASLVSVYSDGAGTYIKQQRITVSGMSITRGEAWQRTLMSGAASSGAYFYVTRVLGIGSKRRGAR